MRFLHLFFAIFVQISLANSGYGKAEKYCPKVRDCCHKCSKTNSYSMYTKCRQRYCRMPGWKGK